METHHNGVSNRTNLVRVGEYEVKSILSGGSQSIVWRAEHRTTRDVVALKQIQLSKLTLTLKNCLDCEIKFLSSINHPNIVRLLDVFKDEGIVVLVLEFCAGGNLATYIRNHGRLQEGVVRRFMQQLAAGLEVLHSHHIIHRDLKPEVPNSAETILCLHAIRLTNILLSCSGSEPMLKIADFGLSRILLSDDFARTVCGSPLYMAPEILQFQRYNRKVDMWSIGAILFELLNGFLPFHGNTNVQLLQNIKKCSSLPFSDIVLSQLHPDTVELCCRLLSVNPEKRFSFDEFYHHNFLKFR